MLDTSLNEARWVRWASAAVCDCFIEPAHLLDADGSNEDTHQEQGTNQDLHHFSVRIVFHTNYRHS